MTPGTNVHWGKAEKTYVYPFIFSLAAIQILFQVQNTMVCWSPCLRGINTIIFLIGKFTREIGNLHKRKVVQNFSNAKLCNCLEFNFSFLEARGVPSPLPEGPGKIFNAMQMFTYWHWYLLCNVAITLLQSRGNQRCTLSF